MSKKEILSGLIAGIMLFLISCELLNYIYVPFEPYEKLLFDSYYEQENIDNLFMGSSHVYCDVNPYVLDAINGQVNFNLASPCQRWDDTYYLLKQADKGNNLKHVYLECYYMDLAINKIWDSKLGDYRYVDFIDDPANYAWPWKLTREMKYSLNRTMILLHSAGKDNTMEILFPFIRFRENLFDWNKINETVMNKEMMKDKKQFVMNYDDVNGKTFSVETLPKGYECSHGGVLWDVEKNFGQKFDLSKQGLGPKSEAYFRKTLKYCRDHDLPVTLFISPIYETQLMSTVDYDGYVNSVREIADEYGVELYDFNMIKDEYLDIKHGKYFNDRDHLNEEGSKMFTAVLWDVVHDRDKDSARNMFYGSYKEKFENEEDEIFGLYYYEMDERDDEREADGRPLFNTRVYTIISGMPDARFRVSRTMWGSDDVEVVQEYDRSATFTLPAYQGGIVTIEALNADDYHKLEVEY